MTFSDFAHVSIEGRVRKSITILLLAFGLGVLAMPAAGTVIKIDDGVEGVLKVTVDDKPCLAEGTTRCFIRGESVSFFTSEVDFTLPPLASRTSSVLIMEPRGKEAGGETQFALSDFLSIRLGGLPGRGVNITINFSSDPDARASDGSPEITEDGTFQDLTPFLLRRAGGNFPADTFPADFKILVRSDIPVTEPSTLLLIGAGVIAFVLSERWRRS
jgi:hypothetical protein